MKSFSLSRFALTLRYLGGISFSKYLSTAGITFAVTVICFVVSDNSFFSGIAPNPIAFFPYTLCLTIAISFFLATMLEGTKARRNHFANLLLLPASNAEKFIASFLMNVVAQSIAISIGFHLAVLIMFPNALVNLFIKGGICSFLFFSDNISVDISRAADSDISTSLYVGTMAASVATQLAIGSLYMLGGVVFSRSRWLLTTILFIVLTFTIFRIIYAIFSSIDFDEYLFNPEAAVWWVTAIHTLTAIGFTALAYHLFKRRQAAQASLLNI
ncbi:MAG: hypothetical protein MR215_09365 [Bacteroidales bacterium]|nr:hypothetical protein [Bacteroidales bacterium]MDD7724355.1 hypothetical protein [Bacteroidales bacterium]MDY4175348.1 hypothetical protein [Bacteroidales bacterium]